MPARFGSWNLSGPQAATLTATHALTVHTPPQASSTASRNSGPAPLAVQFTNRSSGESESSQWDFGDGSSPSGEVHPAHVYALPGAYTVTLTVNGPAGSDMVARLAYVTVRRGVYLPLVLRSPSAALAPGRVWGWPGRVPQWYHSRTSRTPLPDGSFRYGRAGPHLPGHDRPQLPGMRPPRGNEVASPRFGGTVAGRAL